MRGFVNFSQVLLRRQGFSDKLYVQLFVARVSDGPQVLNIVEKIYHSAKRWGDINFN